MKNKSQRYNSDIASIAAKLAREPRSQLNETHFDARDAITIFAFFKTFSDVCDSIGIHEGLPTCTFSNFMIKPASSSLEARV